MYITRNASLECPRASRQGGFNFSTPVHYSWDLLVLQELKLYKLYRMAPRGVEQEPTHGSTGESVLAAPLFFSRAVRGSAERVPPSGAYLRPSAGWWCLGAVLEAFGFQPLKLRIRLVILTLRFIYESPQPLCSYLITCQSGEPRGLVSGRSLLTTEADLELNST